MSVVFRADLVRANWAAWQLQGRMVQDCVTGLMKTVTLD